MGDEALGLALHGFALDQQAELLLEGFGHAGKTKGDHHTGAYGAYGIYRYPGKAQTS